MGITKHSNITLQDLASKLKQCDYIQICGHVSPDGDCISSALATKAALEALGKKVDVLLSSNEAAPKTFDFLKGYEDLVYAGRIKKVADCFLMIDVPNEKRMGVAATKVKNKARTTLTLDHHFEETRFSDFVFSDTSAASTTILVWDLVGLLGVEKTKEIATCCLTGLMTDTGNFQFQNTDLRAFESAAEMVRYGANSSLISEHVYMRNSLNFYKLQGKVIENMQIFCGGEAAISSVSLSEFEETGASKSDFGDMINILRSLDGTRIVAMCREDKAFTKISLRSLGDFDVREIAARFGGGGHAGAAGATTNQDLATTMKEVKEAIEDALSLEEAS
jgi:bifunctional oligoribonuclease and PAP phosphatase NrnA